MQWISLLELLFLFSAKAHYGGLTSQWVPPSRRSKSSNLIDEWYHGGR
jgi:hypothetical protein